MSKNQLAMLREFSGRFFKDQTETEELIEVDFLEKLDEEQGRFEKHLETNLC